MKSVNPRVRSAVSFDQLVDSISKVGLKNPITLTRESKGQGRDDFDLICGRGRLEAFITLGQRGIPAIIENVSKEDRMLRSVIENVARRHHKPLELLSDIGELRKRGYSYPDIATKSGKKYKQIAASIPDMGLIEPLAVTRQKGSLNTYLLLDGHARLQILKDLGVHDTVCLIATDAQSFTYNKRINRLATIQEHKMILKVIEAGVPEDRIANWPTKVIARSKF